MNTSEIMSAMIFGDGGASKVEELSTDGGSTDAGKVLVVGDNGKIAASDLTVGEGEVAIDKGLVVNGAAADAKVVGDAITSLNGRLHQYEEIFTGDVGESVENWLDAHPEATTTVQDGSLTEAKFSDALAKKTVNNYITPEMYGAKGDGTTDDTANFQSAITAAVAAGFDFYAKGEYLISSTITVDGTGKKGITVNIPGTILAGFTNAPAIRFYRCNSWRISINARTAQNVYFGGYDFATENEYHYGLLPGAGVVLSRCGLCEFNADIRNFNVGLRIDGDGGSVYNFIHNVTVWNCAYGIELYAPTNGWVNNNRFDTCTVSVNSGVTNREKAVAIHLFGESNYPNNCNIFEGDYMSADGSPAILMENGLYNVFYFRNEGSNLCIVDRGNWNRFYSNYNSVSFAPTGANSAFNAVSETLKGFKHLVSLDASTVDTVFVRSASSVYYDFVCSGGVQKGVYRNGEFGFVNVFSDPTAIPYGYVPNSAGFFIRLGYFKSLGVRVKGIPDTDIRTLIYMFDSEWNLITNPGDYSLGNAFGGSYFQDSSVPRLIAGANSNDSLHLLSFTDGVEYVFVTASKSWSYMDIYAKDDLPQTKRGLAPAIVSHPGYNAEYPYARAVNNIIHTTKPFIGKRVYSLIDGVERVCTAVAEDGTETWVAKS